MADFIERERAASAAAVDGMAGTARKLWEAACRHDGIDVTATFVVFSEDNPFVPFFASAWRQWAEMRAANAALGYVGIDMSGKLLAPQRRQRER